MKKYMLIVKIEGETEVHFYDDYSKASQDRMDAECGLGAYCELYERTEEDGIRQYMLTE